jgi:hypothetical protein
VFHLQREGILLICVYKCKTHTHTRGDMMCFTLNEQERVVVFLLFFLQERCSEACVVVFVLVFPPHFFFVVPHFPTSRPEFETKKKLN